MKKITKMLMSGTAAVTLLAGVASAEDWSEEDASANVVLNGQLNFNDTWAVADVSLDWIEGCVTVAVAAISNTFTAYIEGDAEVGNYQVTGGDVGAELSATVTNVTGPVDLSAAAIANNATIAIDGASTATVSNTQISGGYDPVANVDAYVGGVGDNVSISGVAVSNNLGVSTTAYNSEISSTQINTAQTNANVSATVTEVTGNVNVSSAAIGNSTTIAISAPGEDE